VTRLPALLLATALLPWPFDLEPPLWAQRVLHNPGERTARGLEAYAAARPEEAAERMEAALRLGGGEEGEGVDPRLLFNAGTARLAAGDEGRAEELLERAAGAEALPAGLGPRASYNLGNARLAGGDPGGAVEAFEEALRLAPDHQAAKHNLEVALRRLAQQRRLPLPGDPGGEGGDDEGGEEGSEQGDRPQPSGAPRPDAPPQGQPSRGGEGEPPRFADQPDMTAEQAAALLDAVEDLERRQRQERAAERARRRTDRGKDW
jgi:tetratricopeptide (TPR) repeat protein